MELLPGPFLFPVPDLMIVQALLSCRVTALQDKLVSWFYISVPSLHLTLLTVGFQTYSADPRFSLDFQHPNNYRLRISKVKLEVRKKVRGGNLVPFRIRDLKNVKNHFKARKGFVCLSGCCRRNASKLFLVNSRPIS